MTFEPEGPPTDLKDKEEFPPGTGEPGHADSWQLKVTRDEASQVSARRTSCRWLGERGRTLKTEAHVWPAKRLQIT
jgi:hypothetical protein